MNCGRNLSLEAMLADMGDEELETYCIAHRSLSSQELVDELVRRWKLERDYNTAQGQEQQT